MKFHRYELKITKLIPKPKKLIKAEVSNLYKTNVCEVIKTNVFPEVKCWLFKWKNTMKIVQQKIDQKVSSHFNIPSCIIRENVTSTNSSFSSSIFMIAFKFYPDDRQIRKLLLPKFKVSTFLKKLLDRNPK